MRPELPQVTRTGDRWVVRIGRDASSGPPARRRPLGLLENEVDLGGLEAGQLDLEVQVDQGLQLDRQDLPVPAGFLGQPIVGKDIGALLGS